MTVDILEFETNHLIMTSEQDGEAQPTSSDPTHGWGGSVEERYKKLKEHVETYPFVWASYIVVYGGFGLWFTYRWRKLRKTEDRVRALQQRLRNLVETEESSSSAAASAKQPTSPLDNQPREPKS